MKNRHLLVLTILTFVSFSLWSQQKRSKNPHSDQLKPRVVVLTDVSTWETDDSESLVRLLAHADLFEIEGLVFTTGWSLDETRDDFFGLIHDAIDAYEKDLPNLLKRSGQEDFLEDESRQYIGYWPTPSYLRERTMYGSKKRGIDHIGEGNESPGSNLIIQQADENDERPLWITVWGGGNTVAQAIWQVQRERSAEELKAFIHKIAVYTITDQDRSYEGGTPYEVSAHQWMRREFKKELMFLWDECAWKFQNGRGRDNWEEYATHIQGHGNLGLVYPKYKFGVEGDTPAFLHILPNGLNDPTVPGHVSWGGYFEWGGGPDSVTFAYTNHQGRAREICSLYEAYFYPATFNNFAARMDWAAEGKGNRNPVIAVNGDQSLAILHMEPKQGETVLLDASKSFDPDDDQLIFKWWVMPEAGTYSGKVTLSETNTQLARIEIPKDAAGKTIHVICEVSDHGTHPLTSYRRIIFIPAE